MQVTNFKVLKCKLNAVWCKFMAYKTIIVKSMLEVIMEGELIKR